MRVSGRCRAREPKHERASPQNAGAEARKTSSFLADREFLPADLEILDTPPSPVRMALILLICALVVVALAWSYFGRIDIIAVAQGKIQPTGRVKSIQPLETGKVAAIHVQNGQRVKAGDVLIEMDPGDAQSRGGRRADPPMTPTAPRRCGARSPSASRGSAC